MSLVLNREFIFLIVQNNQSLLDQLTIKLLNCYPKARIFTALNETIGLDIAQKEKPEIIFLGITKFDNKQRLFCQSIQNHELTKNIPIVILPSEKLNFQTPQKALEFEIAGFLRYPYHKYELIVLVKTLMKTISAHFNQNIEKNNALFQYERRIHELENELNKKKHSEEELKENIAKYYSFFENSLDAMLLTQPDGTIYAANPEACKIFGWTEQEIIKLGRNGLVDDKDPRLPLLLKERKEKGKAKGELLFIRKDGSCFPAELASALFYNSHHQERTIVIVRDITERKKFEEALKKSEEKFRLITENTGDNITVLDLNLNLTYVSPSIMKIRGYSTEEAIHQTLDQIFTPESFKKIMQIFKVQMALEASGSADPKRTISLEAEEYHKNGSTIWVENTMSFLRDDNQKPIGIIATTRDITKRKQAEQALRESEAYIKTILDNLPIGVAVNLLDSKVLFHYMNDNFPKLYQTTREAIEKPNSFWEAVYEDPEFREKIKKKVIKDCASNDPQRMQWNDVPIVRRGQEIRFINAKNTPIPGRQLIISTVMDVTERKRAELALEMSNKKLRNTLESMVETIAEIVETRDYYTAGHQRRVAHLARAIAFELGLGIDRVSGLFMASAIHDIGKIAVPIEILIKPTKLSDLEFGLIKTHPQAGYEILKDIEFPWPIADIILQHHERINGTGYPAGFKGEEILIESRILTVADVVEAIASHRPYRPAKGIETALEEIKRNRGILYEPMVVDCCLSLFKEKDYQFPFL